MFTETEYNRIVWMYQDAYQKLLYKHNISLKNGNINSKVEKDLWIMMRLIDIANRYIESEISLTTVTLNNLTQKQIVSLLRTINCFFQKYNIDYLTKDILSTTVVESDIPVNAITTEAGIPITTEGGVIITTES